MRWLRLQVWLGRNLLPLLGAVFGLALAFLFLSPLLLTLAQSLDLLAPELQRKWFDLLEGVHWRSIQAIILAWVFALGSSIASFLNVVAYRLPRGRNILGRSSCPHCCQQLSLWDNIPVFGWLRNGGRCRTCRLPIAIRYLLVELLLGGTFLALFAADVGTVRTIQALQFSRPELASAAIGNLWLFFGHALLLSLWFAAALIQWERFNLPKTFLATGWALSLAWAIAFHVGYPWWRAMQLPSTAAAAFELPSGNWTSVFASLIAALMIGAILPLGLSTEEQRSNGGSFSIGDIAAFGWIGLFLGWQATLTSGVVAAGLIVLTRGWRTPFGQPWACVFVATLLCIVCEQSVGLGWTLMSNRWMYITAAGLAALVLALSLLARRNVATD